MQNLTFFRAAIVDSFGQHTQYRSRLGQCEFIYGALKSLKEYGLHKDLEAYKKLMNVMPKEKMVPKNYFMEMSFYYAKHQTTAVRLLDYMEQNAVVPDREMQDLILRTFGERGMVWRKMARMNYWMSKIKNASPFPLPEKMPTDSLEMSKILLKRICPDLQTKIQCYRVRVHVFAISSSYLFFRLFYRLKSCPTVWTILGLRRHKARPKRKSLPS